MKRTTEITWDIEIMMLFNDFCLPRETAKSVIRDVILTCQGMSDEEKYRRAWRKFHDIVLAD